MSRAWTHPPTRTTDVDVTGPWQSGSGRRAGPIDSRTGPTDSSIGPTDLLAGPASAAFSSQPPAGPAALAVPESASRSLLRTRITSTAVARAIRAMTTAGMKAVDMPSASTS